MENRKIGLLGAGNMANALIRGLLGSKTLRPEQIRASDVRPDQLAALEKSHGIQTHADNAELLAWANVVVLAVKPQVIVSVLEQMAGAIKSDTLVISIAAGVPLSAIEARLPSGTRVLRAMPNTAAMALSGATGIAAGASAQPEDLALARTLFDAVGRSAVLDESALDAVTGLSGSGPAYVMLIIEALADGGVKVGLSRDTALLLAAQTVYGSAKLLLETGEHPARLKDMVTSPGGTTIAGLHALEGGGLRHTLMNAVEAATRRATELGQAMAAKLTKR
ncbi:MAG TPA: pyrroline-5-carboxylate reductase [Polyangiaceae bacterium]|nr:pyrroline-5-carboxylate reductase [Polyangiaceae bacterium]